MCRENRLGSSNRQFKQFENEAAFSVVMTRVLMQVKCGFAIAVFTKKKKGEIWSGTTWKMVENGTFIKL